MVSWVWIPVALVGGAFIGMFLYALIAVQERDDRP